MISRGERYEYIRGNKTRGLECLYLTLMERNFLRSNIYWGMTTITDFLAISAFIACSTSSSTFFFSHLFGQHWLYLYLRRAIGRPSSHPVVVSWQQKLQCSEK